MKLHKLKNYILIFISLLSVFTFSVYAVEDSIQTKLLNYQAGSPKDPRNIKLSVTLPESYGKTKFTADDFSIYIYPQALNIATGKHKKYKANKILLWQHNNQLFLDIRKPPKQRYGGDHTLYIEINKNNHSIYKSELSKKISYEDDEVDVVLIIDSSLSMHSNDPYRNRLRAAKAFADIARSDKRIKNIGIVSFNNKAKVIADLTPVRNSRRLHNAIDSINAEGQTNIGTALTTGLNILDTAKSRRTAAVLLTDGKNESSIYQNQHLDFAKQNIPVYCIGLSNQADTKLLKQIAEETNASFFKASTDNDLLGIYQRIASVISRKEVIFSSKIPLSKDKINIPVDNSIKDICFMLNAGMDEVIFELVSPEGEKFDVIPSKNLNFSEIRITKPEAGLWTMLIRNRAAKHDLELNVTANTSLYLDSFPPLQAGNKVWLSGTLADNGNAIDNSNIQVISKRGRVKLFDDGIHNDGNANDGVYTCNIPVEREFDLNLLLRAWGSKQTPYIRETNAGLLKRQIIKVEKPKINYELQANSDLIFPPAYAGETITKEINLNYMGLPREFKASFSSLENSVYSINSENLKLSNQQIIEGKNKIIANLKIPADMPSGKYIGNLKISTPETELNIPVSVNIKNSKLLVNTNKLHLGYLNNNQTHTCNINLTLNAAKAEKLLLIASNPEFAINYDHNYLIKPNKETTFTFSIISKNYNIDEEQRQNIIIKAGDLQQNLEIGYNILPEGKKQKTLFFAHEMSLPEVSKQVTVCSINHEMAIPKQAIIVKPETPVIQKPNKKEQFAKLELTDKSLEKAITSNQIIVKRSEEESSLLIILIIIATIALSAILLIIRKLSNKRMVRFALLSATLHLPIIAIIASYIIVTGNSTIPHKKAPVANMVIAKATVNDNYITRNSTTLKNLNNDKSLKITNNNLNEEIEYSTDINSTNISSDPEKFNMNDSSLTAATINPLALKKSELIKNNISQKPDFDFNELAIKTPVREESIESTQNIKLLQNEINSTTKPELPLEDIFKTTELISNNPNYIKENISNNSTELAEVVNNEISIDEEINNILLNSDEADNSINEPKAIKKIVKADTSEVLDNNEIIKLPEITPLSHEKSYAENTLSRNLNTEINQTAQLKSLTHNTPLAEDPEQLLTSIDKTIPIEKENKYDLIIPSEEISNDVSNFNNEVFDENSSYSDVITEANPRPIFDVKKITTDNFNSDSINEIPGVTSDGSCLDLNAITESYNISRTNHSISKIPESSPEIDDLKLDDLTIGEEEPIQQISNKYEEDLVINEKEIEIPDEDTLKEVEYVNPQSEILASIDSLDINIDRKINHLTDNNKINAKIKNSEIKRINTTLPNSKIRTEKYIPSQPNIQKITSGEVLSNKPVNNISEIPDKINNDISINNFDANKNEIIINNQAIAKIPVQSNDQVKITNSPEKLNTIMPSTAKLLKIPNSLQSTTGINTDTDMNSVSLNVGIISAQNNKIGSELNSDKNISFIDLTNSSDILSDLLTCQLIITDKEEFSNDELKLLKDYLTSGGYLWIQNNGIPQELASIGQVKSINNNDKIFNSIYEISKNSVLFAEELSYNSNRKIIATGFRDKTLYKALLQNIFATLFKNYNSNLIAATPNNQKVATSSYTWQNFSGVDKSTLGWEGSKWGNTVKTGIAPDGQGGEALMVNIKAGREDITCINYIIPDFDGRRIDLSDNSAIILDIYNASKRFINISLGLTTEGEISGWDEFETQKTTLQAGWNRNIAIPLKNFRSRRDPHGGYTHDLESANNCARVSLYFTNIKDGANLLVDNIKWAE